ncbi:hypothetical protein GTW20_25805 [Nocardiopsis alba]|uniref:Uncharacterized protein n=1 Tax=Nocardiopsis alba TaxID=53437 RepID=A0A7K2J0J4_9ACTN|nr:hypothetical protein [Nocardiopsis alba]MYR35584.1 hypothetical protein [Nocardiopsis alba]
MFSGKGILKLIIDTQELIRLSKERAPLPCGGQAYMASTTAQELFRTRSKETGRPAYWVPSIRGVHQAEIMSRKEWRNLAKAHSKWNYGGTSLYSDRLLVEFGSDYPPVVEFGHRAISKIINEEKTWLFPMCAGAARVKFGSEMRGRVEYVAESNVRCSPLVGGVIKTALPMFHAFSKKYTFKKDYRNSLNDIFILATSGHLGIPLLTRDKLLARFAEECLGSRLMGVQGCELISPQKGVGERRVMKESRKYVNRSWRIIQTRR